MDFCINPVVLECHVFEDYLTPNGLLGESIASWDLNGLVPSNLLKLLKRHFFGGGGGFFSREVRQENFYMEEFPHGKRECCVVGKPDK